MRRRSASRGGWMTMVRIAVHRSVSASAAVLVAALDPGDAERIGRGADDAGDIDGDLLLAELGEGIVGAGIIVQRRGARCR